MGDLYNKYVGYSNIAVKLEKEIQEALSPVIEKYQRMGYKFDEIMDVMTMSEDYLRLCHEKPKSKSKQNISTKKRELDYLVAEKLLGWEKKTVTKGESVRKIWMDKDGHKIDIIKTPKFSSSMKVAMKLYKKYEKEVDDYWLKKPRPMNAENICKAILDIKKIKY